MPSTATLFVRFSQPGIHCWPDGPGYLATPHRHQFYVEVQLDSSVDDERSVEFHELLEHAKTVFRDVAHREGSVLGAHNYGRMSCESMADAVGRRLAKYYNRTVSVSVSEDDECGAIVVTDIDEL